MRRTRFAVQVAVAALLLARGSGLVMAGKAIGPRRSIAWREDGLGPSERIAGSAEPVRGFRAKIGTCVKYSKEPIGNEGLRMQLRNSCDFGVSCALSWELRCLAGGRPTARSSRLDLASGASDAALAYGTGCGPGRWEIAAIRWTCEQIAPPSPPGPARDPDLSE